MKRALIVEDVAETRRWLGELMREAFPECEIHEAERMREAMRLAEKADFDIALIDLGLPDGSGLDVLRAFRELQPETICIVTTVMGDDTHIVLALAAGAQGYLLKEQPGDVLWRQIKQVAQGVPALSPSIARRIMEHFRRTGPVDDGSVSLSAREREVLGLIGSGMRNAEVARALSLSELTVGGYIKDIYRKLGISTRAEAAWHAARLGLIGPPPRS
jgi:DNA-binding NarL/FixJ family response regulator